MSLIIENNVVKKYVEDSSETTIIIPEGVSKIGFCAFNESFGFRHIGTQKFDFFRLPAGIWNCILHKRQNPDRPKSVGALPFL